MPLQIFYRILIYFCKKKKNPMKVLIVEDRQELADNVAQYLSSQDYLCEQATSRRDALMMVSLYDYDCILLDLMLPDGSGMDVLRWLKLHKPSVGVIVVSARNSTEDIVEGLKIGADDYISKPFGMAELVARVRARLRRTKPAEPDCLIQGELVMDRRAHTVTVAGEAAALTYKEYELLRILMENAGTAFTRERLLERIWDYAYDGGTRTVDVHVQTLRAKLGQCGDLIETVRGVGYRMRGGKQ